MGRPRNSLFYNEKGCFLLLKTKIKLLIYEQIIDKSIKKCSNNSTMKKRFDISDFVNIPTIQSTLVSLTDRVKERRKELKISQKLLAQKSGVSYASIRRFESTGDIALVSLLKIASVLNCLEDFNALFSNKIITSLKDLKV